MSDLRVTRYRGSTPEILRDMHGDLLALWRETGETWPILLLFDVDKIGDSVIMAGLFRED